jgi:hypothetical protein
MKALAAAVGLAIVLTLSGGRVANAGPKEALVDYTHKLLVDGDLPPIADNAELLLVDDGKPKRMTAQQLRESNDLQKRIVKNMKLLDFAVQNVDCGEKLCFIRYTQRISLMINNQKREFSSSSEEVYVQTSDGFLLERAYQVQHSEGEL